MLDHERRQLPLPFQQPPQYDPRNFIPATSNQDALAWLSTTWPEQRLALFGPGGCGKSHLLSMWAKQARAIWLTGPTLNDLADLPLQGAVALDDADTILDEHLLLHLLNSARDRALQVLLSGRTAPARWAVRLPDLSSRLRAITAVEIRSPDDNLLAALLVHQLAERQLTVPDAVQSWLLLRLPRSSSVLREVVARLDRASLASGASITRQFAAQVLAETNFVAAEPEGSCGSQGKYSSRPRGFL